MVNWKFNPKAVVLEGRKNDIIKLHISDMVAAFINEHEAHKFAAERNRVYGGTSVLFRVALPLDFDPQTGYII